MHQKSSYIASNLRWDPPVELQRRMEFASEKEASSWLITLLIEEFGFTLHQHISRYFGFEVYMTGNHFLCQVRVFKDLGSMWSMMCHVQKEAFHQLDI